MIIVWKLTMNTSNSQEATVIQPIFANAKRWRLYKRQLCDLECLLTNVFAPLKGFLDRENYDSVCQSMRLKNGALCPMPVTLDVTSSFAAECEFGEEILLVNGENQPLASMIIHAIWKPNKKEEAQLVFGTTDKHHPGVAYLYEKAGDWYLGGEITALKPMIHYDFLNYRHTPAELKQLFKVYGWSKIVAFQTRNLIHRVHFELIRQVMEEEEARLLIHPVIGMTMLGEIDPVIRIKCYEQLLRRFLPYHALLSLVPMAMRVAGPREALWHAIIQKNYGATHFIIGPDHGSPIFENQNCVYYPMDSAQVLVEEHAKEIGINIIAAPRMVYVKEKSHYISMNNIDGGEAPLQISSKELIQKIASHENIPDWYSFPEVIAILKKAYPSRLTQGYTIFFTGAAGSGKSIIANALLGKILEANARTVTLVDGDTLQKQLFTESDHAKDHHDKHTLRLGYIAQEITKHHGIVICTAIAPFASVRQHIRESICRYGGFIEVYVTSPVYNSEKKASEGSYYEDAIYEPSEIAEITIDTSHTYVNEAVDQILNTIESLGYTWCHPSQELHKA